MNFVMLDVQEASALFFRTSLHFILFLLPCLAVCVFAVRRGVRDTVLLGSIGLAATAISGYIAFFLYFLSFHLIRPAAFVFEGAAIYYLARNFKFWQQEERECLRPLVVPTLLVFTSTVLILGAAFAYGGFNHPLETAQNRFSHPLPTDNSLPYLLGEDMMRGNHQIPHPFFIDWRSSDRPPLQTGLYLSQYPAAIAPRPVSYETLSAVAQSFWIFGLWLLLYALGVHRRAIACVLAGSLFTNFVFLNTLFVWPKLLPAGYFFGFAALILSGRFARTFRHRQLAAIVAGTLCAWSFLAHGGTLFVFAGMAAVFPFLYRRWAWRPVGLFLATAVVLYFPWICYQKFVDPPGDRLLKWHLAGVQVLDARPFGQTFRDSYHDATLQQILANKSKNFQFAFGERRFFEKVRALLFQAPPANRTRADLRAEIGRDINGISFFFFVPNVGFYILGLPFLVFGLLRRFRSTEWKAAGLLGTVALLTNMIWCCLIFGPPSYTINHAGSYAVELLAYAVGILGFWAVSEALAFSVVGLQIALFVFLEFFVLAPAGQLNLTTSALCGLSLIASTYLLYCIGKKPSPAGVL